MIFLDQELNSSLFDLCSGTAGVMFSAIWVPFNWLCFCIKETRQDFPSEGNLFYFDYI